MTHQQRAELPPDEWITTLEAVARYKIISTTLYYLRTNGVVRAVTMPDDHPERKRNVPHQWLYSVSDIGRWNVEHKVRKSRAQLRAQHRVELAEQEHRLRRSQ